MRDGHRQPVVAVAELRDQHAAPAHAAGQGMVVHFDGLELRQQPVRAGGETADVAVGLVAPVRETPALREVMRLVGEPRAQAPGVAFVEADDVVAARQLRDRIQAAALVARGQHVRPTARRVIRVTPGARPGLDVRAEQLEAAVGHQPGDQPCDAAAGAPPAARSFAIRPLAMRSMSSKLLPVTLYLPLTISVGVLFAPERIMNWRPLLTCAFTEKEFIVLRNSFGLAPYLP